VRSSRGRWRLLRWLILAVLVVGPLIVLRTRWAWNEACALARQRLPEVLKLDLAIGRCEIDPLRQGVKLYDVTATVPGERGPPLLTAESAEVRLGTFAPLFGTIKLAMVHLGHPRLRLDLSRPPPQGKGARTCPLDALDRVSLEKLAAHDATLELRFPGGRALELSAVDLEWTTRRGVVELRFESGSGVMRQGEGRPDLLVGKTQLEGSLDVEAQQLQISPSAEGVVEDVTWSVTGKVDTLCDPDLALDVQAFVPLRTLAKVVPLPDQPEKPQGQVQARVTVTGRPASPALTAELTGANIRLGKLEAPTAHARLALEGKELRVVDLSVPAGALGAAHLSGTVGLQGNFPVRALVVLERAELGKVLDVVGMKGAWVNLLATGRVGFSGSGHPLQLDGDGELSVFDFRLAARPYDAPAEGRPVLELKEGKVRGALRVLPDRVELTELSAVTGRSLVTARGVLRYSQEAGLQLDGKAEPLDLSDFGHLARFDWRGTGAATFSVKGPYRDVRAEAQLSFKDFSFWDYSPGAVQGALVFERRALHFPSITGQKGKTQFAGSVDLDWSREKNGTIQLQLKVPRGRAEDLVDTIVRLHPSVELFQGELTGEAGAEVELSGPFDEFGGKIDLDLSGVRYYGRDLGQGKVQLRFHRGEVLQLAEAHLTGPVGRISGEGTFDFEGPLSFRFRGEDLSLLEMVGPKLARQMGARGKLQLSGKVVGDREVPVVEGYLTAPQVYFADQPLGTMNLNARIQGRELHVWGRPFDDASGSLKMTLRAPIPYQLRLSLSLPEIRPLLPDTAISQGLSGSLSGTINAQGEVKTKDSDVVQAVVEQFALSRGDFSGQSSAPINVSYQRGRWAVDGLSFVGPDTQLTAGGWMGPDALDVRAQGAADMRLLASFVPGLERTGGLVEMSVQANGPLSSPAVLGSARVRDVRFTVRDAPFQLRSLSGDIEFSERQARIEDMDGVLNDGRVALAGYVEMERFLPRRGGCRRREENGSTREIPCLHLQVTMDEMAMRPLEDLPFNTSGTLEVYGDPDSLVLAGALSVDKLRYERPMDLEAFLKDFARTRERLVQSSQSDRRKEWLKFNVGVDLQDVRLENNLARARFVGKVTLTGTNARPGLLGTVEAAEGSQLFFRQNRFDISEMIIELKDRYSMDAVFDVHAQSQVREYLVRLHAFGHPNEPKVILTSEPQLAEADVLSLLTLGVTSRDKSQSTGVETASYLAAEALYNASGLDREVQRFLPRNSQLVKDLSFHFSTSYNDVLHQMEPAAQIESRILSDDLKLELTRPFSGRGTRARAEYRLLDGVLVQGQWDNENSTSGDLGNFGVDLKLHWEVK